MAISNSTDRFNGVVASLAIKVRCVVGVESNVASLTGISNPYDGIFIVDGDRVLLTAQTDPIENGVWNANAVTGWTRAADWDGNRDVEKGSTVWAGLASMSDKLWQVQTAGVILPGTTAQSITELFDPNSVSAASLQAVTDVGNTTTNDLDLVGSDLLLDDNQNILFGSIGGGEFSIGFDGNQDLEIIDVSGSNTGIRIGPGINNLRLNPEAAAAATFTLGEPSVLRGDGANSTLNMYGEDTGAISLGFLQSSGVAFWMNAGTTRLQFTANAGASEAEFNVASLKLLEVAAPVADELTYGQLWVNEVGNVLTYRDELGEDFDLTAAGGGAVGTIRYAFDTALGGDPGAGEFRMSTANPANIASLQFSSTDATGLNVDNILGEIPNGAHLIMRNTADNTQFRVYKIFTVTDNTGWYQFTCDEIRGSGDATIGPAGTEIEFEFFTTGWLEPGVNHGNPKEIAYWNSSNGYWEGSGSLMTINPASPPLGGRLGLGTTSGYSTTSPQILRALGAADTVMDFVYGTDANNGFLQGYRRVAGEMNFGARIASANTDLLTLDLLANVRIEAAASFKIEEQGAAAADLAGHGQLWVNSADDSLNYQTEAGANFDLTAGGGASQLSDLSDVNTSTPTNRFVLVADGVDFESRQIGEADILQLPANNGIFLSLGLNNTITGGITVDNQTVNWIFGNSTDVIYRSAGDTENWRTSMTGTVVSNQGSGFAPPDLEMRWNNFTRLNFESRIDTHASLAVGGNSNPGSGAPFRIPHGVTPSTPVNGDFWTTTAGLFVEINGGTVGPLSAGGGVSFPLDVPDSDQIRFGTGQDFLMAFDGAQMVMTLVDPSPLRISNAVGGPFIDLRDSGTAGSGAQATIRFTDSGGVVQATFGTSAIVNTFGASITGDYLWIANAGAGTVRFDAISLQLTEAAAPAGDVLTIGQFWIDSADALPYFRDELGVDHALTVSSLLTLSETAAIPAPGSTFGTYGVRSFAPNQAYFATDIDQEFGLMNVIGEIDYLFDTSTASGDPGSGEIRYNSATPSGVTAIYVNDLDSFGANQGNLYWDNVQVGDIIETVSVQNSSDFMRMRVLGPSTDNTGWHTIPVEIIDSGTIHAVENIRLKFSANGGNKLQSYSIANDDQGTVSDANQTLDYEDGPVHELDLENWTTNRTLTLSNFPANDYGQQTVKVQQDGTSARTITWAGGSFIWRDGAAHVQNATLNGISIYTFESWDGGTTIYAAGADYS